jgi:hypothetical protein
MTWQDFDDQGRECAKSKSWCFAAIGSVLLRSFICCSSRYVISGFTRSRRIGGIPLSPACQNNKKHGENNELQESFLDSVLIWGEAR